MNSWMKKWIPILSLAVVPIVFASSVHNLWVAASLVGLAAAAHQGWSCNLFTLTSDMFPRSAVGAVVGFGGMTGAIGGMLVSKVIGYVLQATNSNYRIGDEVFMLLNLMGEDEKLPVAGRVIWVTPKGAQGKRTAGIGVQFSEQDRGNTQRKIESYLAGALGGDKPTHTM
jgi:Tfp pilus assembly protein PilZ